MNITSAQIYDSLIHGAYNVIKNREQLNRINIFPVQDGDTGSNLSSMMRTIIQKAEQKETVKKTLESVADASLFGARGNSGIIFAQYFRGLSESITGEEQVSVSDYAKASIVAAQYAYEAVESPVEGTMLTIMREWGNYLNRESLERKALGDIFSEAFKKLEHALEKTKDQLAILKKANVVDSGAKGFTCFIEGTLYYIQNQEKGISDSIPADLNHYLSETDTITEAPALHGEYDGYRYCTECLLDSDNDLDFHGLKTWLEARGNSTVIAGNKNRCRVHIHTNEPAEIFDYLYERGTILYQKVDDMYRQEQLVKNRKYKIALVTDSIADLPQEMIDDQQIQVVHLDILFKDMIFMDKLTVFPNKIIDLSGRERELPTSSQPNPKNIENLLDYLFTYYNSIIVMSVSKELSGTYHTFNTIADRMNKDGKQIRVINTKQNSGAQGLLVRQCAELIKEGRTYEEIVKEMEALIPFSKILVQVRTLDNMIKSGRLSVRAGQILKKIGFRPVITLDEAGKGKLEAFAFSLRTSDKKILNEMKRIKSKNKNVTYCIVHVNNETQARELADKLTQIMGNPPDYIMETSSIVAISAGEGALAVSYLIKEEKICI